MLIYNKRFVIHKNQETKSNTKFKSSIQNFYDSNAKYDYKSKKNYLKYYGYFIFTYSSFFLNF